MDSNISRTILDKWRNEMKGKYIISIIFLIACLFMFSSQAMAARGCNLLPDGSVDYEPLIDLDPTAPGQKYYGVMTAYFQDTPPLGDNQVDMYIFIRLGAGNDLYTFADVEIDVPYGPSSLCDKACVANAYQVALEDFFGTVIVPTLNWLETDGQWCTPGSTCPPFGFKTVSKIVEDMGGWKDSYLSFNILDFTLAVQY